MRILFRVANGRLARSRLVLRNHFVRQISSLDVSKPLDDFPRRHIGCNNQEANEMLTQCGFKTLSDLVDKVVPANILSKTDIGSTIGRVGLGEQELLHHMKQIAGQNKVFKDYIGLGYYPSVTPPVILRNILENPGWYTQYTPYQAEISQGRLESLLNFQTLICELTGLPVANASLLDEGTAAAEAMQLCVASAKPGAKKFLVDKCVFPQTFACMSSRAAPLGIQLEQCNLSSADWESHGGKIAGVLVQYPDSIGAVKDLTVLASRVHKAGGQLVVAADLLALAILSPPGGAGADIVIGSSQRFGIPLGFGGPHAAFFAIKDELKRRMPGRLIGVSKDRLGKTALRLALQTREQHIRREKATSNICTAQALLANMAAMYAVYHGPKGLNRIATKIHLQAKFLAQRLAEFGFKLASSTFFDTLAVNTTAAASILRDAQSKQINLRAFPDSLDVVGLSLNETTTAEDVAELVEIFRKHAVEGSRDTIVEGIPAALERQGAFLQQDVFNKHHSETQMLRYITHLQSKDLSLCQAMIPLGSCTMKLNATSEMIPLSWPEFSNLHPFAPPQQAAGYEFMLDSLSQILAQITGFDAVSLQPNSGAQGEYAGLRVIKAFHESQGQSQRNVCLIPVSAHGTNPASAAMVGFRVVVVKCTASGALDMDDLEEKIKLHGSKLAAIMVTYPSTYGTFDKEIVKVCDMVHAAGGQVYMDGANLNAQIGLTMPGKIGADVLHMNLHKTFCIPHGGGGPGMGPIAVREHLSPFLPGHPLRDSKRSQIQPVSAAPFGSASILTISYAYLKLMGGDGLKKATQMAILNANYLKARLEGSYKVRFANENNCCAHEFIIDCAPFEKSSGLEAVDIAKRLHDYSFHSPTMSFPVSNTLMIEPTESEPKEELDRFVEAMLSIRREIQMVEDGVWPRDNNPLVNAPHPIATLVEHDWDKKYPYSRQVAAYPLASLYKQKFWPTTNRVDDTFGDRNLVCSCPPTELYA